MRKIFEWIGGFAIVAFSFYFTDKVSLLVANKSDLMQEIKAVSSVYEESPVDAQIDDENNSIIPGEFGRTVNSQESYLSMHDFGSFNENYLVFDYIKPKKSLEDNKDKYITSGIKSKRQISIISLNNLDISQYLEASKVPFNKVVDSFDQKNESIELINGASIKDKFNALNSKLTKESKFCLKEFSNIDLCKKNDYYLVDPQIKLNSSNLIEVKNSIGPGSIILVTSTAKLEDLKVIMSDIDRKDLSIVLLSKLVDERERSR